MNMVLPNNFAELSEAAFHFANRSKKWTFEDSSLEGVYIQEYWTPDLIRNGEDSVTFYQANTDVFEDLKQFVSAITIISFEDLYSIDEHASELSKINAEAISRDAFNERWYKHASLVAKQLIKAPREIIHAYSTYNDWNHVTIFAENTQGYYALMWETSA